MDDLAALNLTDRPDPISLLEEQAESRLAELVPIRYGRMVSSPFSFYRGAALVMASDLARGPRTNLIAQLCGDAHLVNFGMYGSPERRLVFDINDFDETLPGPIEWDVKRLCASIEVAARDRGDKGKERRAAVRTAAARYRTAMLQFAGMNTLDVWYALADVENLLAEIQLAAPKANVTKANKMVTKVMSRNSVQAMKKLTVMEGDRLRIVSEPPLVVRIEDVIQSQGIEYIQHLLSSVESDFANTLSPDRRHLFAQYTLRDAARKVVGVGSVGTRCWIALFTGKDDSDPLFLQLKEAQASVLERFTAPSEYSNHGERVVQGQRIMQAVSDVFLGWEKIADVNIITRDFYVRQLRDWKGSVDVTGLVPEVFGYYGAVCAWTLAKAHARSGDRFAIAEYLGTTTDFEDQMVEFSTAYADQNALDHQALADAIASGRLTAQVGV
ncbi:MAG: DUF2252 domain-containing protein [Actinobacteria bacterium]|nr:DUF2252 domain-containing protein [Actinomycetota bacterium]